MRDKPHWWDWEFVPVDHLFDRMPERGFNEADVRQMIEEASEWAPDSVPGRFVLTTIRKGERWEIIVEPVEEHEQVDIVTAYRVS